MWLIRVTFASHLIQISTSKYFRWGLSFFQISWKRFLGQNEQFLTRIEAQMGSSWTFVGVFQIFEQRNKTTAQRLPSALIALITCKVYLFVAVANSKVCKLQRWGQVVLLYENFLSPWNFPKARVDGNKACLCILTQFLPVLLLSSKWIESLSGGRKVSSPSFHALSDVASVVFKNSQL